MRITLVEIGVGIVFVGLVGFVVLSPFAMSNPSEGQRVLEQQGYTDVKFLGIDYMNCGRDDLRRDKFEITNSKGTFNATVCSGLFKGYTIRY